ncbi:MAG: hypothetical protein KKD90_03145 [Candidatus Omnitrophica bacterium]|nr:hypothetical protein [Candidatus Omnitrophota bacterium]MBU4149379.1 hypothetical protein [Candidatus Omnitrophota bacterium]
MKAFLVGLIFIIAVLLLSGIGFLLLPFIFVLGVLIRILLSIIFVILCVWLLGRFIIFVFELFFKRKEA